MFDVWYGICVIQRGTVWSLAELESSSSPLESLQLNWYNGNLVKEVRLKEVRSYSQYIHIFELSNSFSTWILIVKWMFKCSIQCSGHIDKHNNHSTPPHSAIIIIIITTKYQIKLIQQFNTIWKTLITSFLWEFRLNWTQISVYFWLCWACAYCAHHLTM